MIKHPEIVVVLVASTCSSLKQCFNFGLVLSRFKIIVCRTYFLDKRGKFCIIVYIFICFGILPRLFN